MKISFTLWCVLIDLLEVKKNQLQKKDFKVFEISDCTCSFYEALFSEDKNMMFEIILDEFNSCMKYINHNLLNWAGRDVGECFGKKITFQFCVYRY